MKNQPIGIDSFKDIITEGYFYIDKTKFIEEVCQNFKKSLLFTRPRRFGKSLNMSMLKYFFDIENKEENRKLFKGLYIETSEYMKYQGEHPVILISLKDIDGLSFEDSLKKIRNSLSNLYNEFEFILETLNKRDKIKFEKIWLEEEDANYSDALRFLSEILYKYYNKKAIVLIDEYDTPIISAYQNGYYKEAVIFFKNLYGSVLKSNEYLEMGVITGIVRVAQAGIFSDLNNLDIYTILRKDYEEFFGFTEDEIKDSLAKFGKIDKFEEVKYWYDGYKFGDMEIYNPWSIINYLKNNEFKAYWVNTSSNTAIIEMLKKAGSDIIQSLEDLIDEKEAIGVITEQVKLNKDLSENEIWEFLLFAGYLKIVRNITDDIYTFRIPNNEIKKIFKKTFIEMIFNNETVINTFRTALIEKDIRKIKSSIEELLLYGFSYWELRKENKENIYQSLLSGFMYGLEGVFRIYPNKETGYGRADIVLEPLYSKTGYIFELKVKGNKENPLEQIEEKRYDAELKRKGITDIVKIGMIFDGKKVEIIR